MNATENATENNIHVRKDCEPDGRMRNRGSSNRTTYNSEHKWKHIAQFETWFDQKKDTGEPLTVTAYIHENQLPIKFKIPFNKESRMERARYKANHLHGSD